jgi:hypothetical protein
MIGEVDRFIRKEQIRPSWMVLSGLFIHDEGTYLGLDGQGGFHLFNNIGCNSFV